MHFLGYGADNEPGDQRNPLPVQKLAIFLPLRIIKRASPSYSIALCIPQWPSIKPTFWLAQCILIVIRDNVREWEAQRGALTTVRRLTQCFPLKAMFGLAHLQPAVTSKHHRLVIGLFEQVGGPCSVLGFYIQSTV